MEKTEELNKKNAISYDHLEAFSLLWITGEIKDIDEKNQQHNEQKLRAIINYLKTFENVDEFQQYLDAVSKKNRFVIIVNDRFCRELVPIIHQLFQISSIYIYCANSNKHKKWSKDFPKIRAVTNQFDEILVRIEVDQKIRMKIEEPLSIKPLINEDHMHLPTSKLDDSCIHFQILMDILLRIRSNNEDINELFCLCKKEYKGNKNHLAILREFQYNYTSSVATQWYMYRPLLQKILNKAFYTENIDILYLFRSLIRDIFYQLRHNQCQSPVRTYKGQLMLKSQLNNLKKSTGKIISINSFLLTTVDRESVIYDLDETTPSNNVQKIIFEINADSQTDISIPFAKISSENEQDGDNDILFMPGSFFRLVSISYDKNKKCIIRMTLCNDDEPDLKQLFENMREEFGYGETNLLPLGVILRDMGKFDLAEKYLLRMLKKLPANDPLLDALYPTLGLVAKDKGNFNKCLYWFRKSLKVYTVTRPSDYVSIGDTYNTIGRIYHANKNQYEKALDCFNKAVLLFKQFDAEMHPMMATFYDSIGAVHEEQRNYAEALTSYQKAFNIKKRNLSNNHLQLGISYKNIAAANGYLGFYDTAIEHYKKALEIQLKSLSSQHPDVALTYANMAAVYSAKNRSQQALNYWHKANDIFRNTLLPQHPLVVKIEEEIKLASTKVVYHAPIKKMPKKTIAAAT